MLVFIISLAGCATDIDDHPITGFELEHTSSWMSASEYEQLLIQEYGFYFEREFIDEAEGMRVRRLELNSGDASKCCVYISIDDAGEITKLCWWLRPIYDASEEYASFLRPLLDNGDDIEFIRMLMDKRVYASSINADDCIGCFISDDKCEGKVMIMTLIPYMYVNRLMYGA